VRLNKQAVKLTVVQKLKSSCEEEDEEDVGGISAIISLFLK